MTPDPLTNIMQAAERLNRLDAREPRESVYPSGGRYPYLAESLDALENADHYALSAYLRSILPKGDRPVPIENPEDKQDAFVADGGEVLPVRYQDGHWEHGYTLEEFLGTSIEYMPVLGDAYHTEADAKLALQWMMWDRLRAASP